MQKRLGTPPKRHAKAAPEETTKLREELRQEKLRRLAAERQVAELTAKFDELNERFETLLRSQNKTQEMLQKTVRKLEKDVADRDEKLARQDKTIAVLRKKVFGRATEKGKALDPAREAKSKEAKKAKKKRKGQQKGSDGHGRTDRSGVPVGDVVVLDVSMPCKCEHCGTFYKKIDTTDESRLYEYVESLYVDIYERNKYVSQCQCNGRKIVTAAPPPKLYPKTDIGNSLWVELILQKFLRGMPTNRTLKEFSLLGFKLSAGTVTGGFKIINELIDPLYEAIAKHCRAAELWNADETTWRVFNGAGKKWWMWLVASPVAVAYILDPTRSGDVPQAFFEGCSGTLMTDRLGSYKTLDEAIKKAWCWVHVRRDFYNIWLGVPELRQWAKYWLKQIGKLFGLVDERFKLWERRADSELDWIAATEKIEKHLNEMRVRWQKELRNIGQPKEQRKVLNSLRRHWEGLTLFVGDPRVPLHNNRAERLLRDLVILRKGCYGSGARWAGEFAAKVLSILQTWLINGLNPQQMLQDYFDECSKTSGKAPFRLSAFLPWEMTDEQKSAAALPAGFSRPG